MHKIDVVVKNETGLHARPATIFITEASKYKSDITVEKDGKEYSGKSIISILSMGAVKGDKLTLSISGEDEKKAATELEGLFIDGLTE
ncbi:HPr family phosphocarrier protein [Sporosalibacterium faouarense]|uniref:HPr family phosphocarrier protein n=1 Tax=Sporosalibacterium faouarense TaxID=516123 RepID=UPI00141CDE54|nr:HPr family phosphocarrier protein [Sporosalibacterium faouarense]MTI46283.1 HPr family phosphocarrier protein [Bacillota bacterium]